MKGDISSRMITNMFQGAKGQFTQWKAGVTKNGDKKWSKIWDYKWVNIVLFKNKENAFVTYDNKKIDLVISKNDKDILIKVHKYVCELNLKQ